MTAWHEWRPIETAPLDGTHVLVVDENAVSEARYIEGHGWYLAQNDPTDSWGPGPLTPSHWMHLPPPPNERLKDFVRNALRTGG
jgi:hypothetical protein